MVNDIENMEVIASFYTPYERVIEELEKYLKRKRVKIEEKNENGLIGWSDNRFVKIDIQNNGPVTVLYFYEKYSDESIMIDSELKKIGALTASMGALSNISSKGRSGGLTTSYGASKVLNAEKRILKKLIGPTFKRNIENLDAINEMKFVNEKCGSILIKGGAKYFNIEKGKITPILGNLIFGTKGVLYISDPSSGLATLIYIEREEIIRVSKGKLKRGFLYSSPTIRVETHGRWYDFFPINGRFKPWMGKY